MDAEGMKVRRWGPTDYRDMPWKNGGGVTRELWKLPHPSDPGRFLVRLSIAQVAASGPFSLFPGVERTLVLLEGEGMELTSEGLPPVRLDTRWQPFVFAGETVFQCRLLGGPVRDFNLMVDRALLEGSLEVIRLQAGATRTVSGAGEVLLHGLEGRARVSGAPLARDETLWLEAPGSLTLEGEEAAVVIAIHLSHRAA